ncbi:phthiocerol/phthiodiolone dimycocerosyl transferase family protein [Nocardia sp. 004]|uniref:phthiocerol/phthiodiolone dimycocerosyl transferase family protein n=1 Tax=Nocardia sp. 004 TaxID=3385978 RepID=UPI0039A3AFAC
MIVVDMVRRLAPSEVMFAVGEVFIGYSVRVSGYLDPVALTTAFAAVARAHPVLRARIDVSEAGEYMFTVSDTTPEIFITDADPEFPLTGAKSDQRAGVCALCVIRDGATACVTLLIHHSVADAAHAFAVVTALWTAYRDVVDGRTPELPVHTFPMPVEQLLLARGIEKMSLPGSPPTAESPAPPPVQQSRGEYPELRTTRCRLTEDETAALVELGHREAVTMHGLVSAALLHTEAEIRELPLTELLYLYSVDLRTRVSPEIAATEGTNVLGFANYLSPEAAMPLVELARGISAALHAGVTAGIVQRTPLHIPEVAAAPPPALPGVVVATNWGTIPALSAQDGLRIEDFHSTMLAKPDPTGRRPKQPGDGTCIISTFADRLSVEIHHPEEFTDLQRHRVDVLAATLRAALA